MNEKEKERQKNRQKMPICTEFIDAMKSEFGENQIKINFVSENGIEKGSK